VPVCPLPGGGQGPKGRGDGRHGEGWTANHLDRGVGPGAAPASAANGTADAKLSYRGFALDTAAVRTAANFAAVESSFKHQLDIVADCGAKPEILAFFRKQEIVLKLGASDGGGHFSSNTKGVTVDAVTQPQQKPIVLHELLHAYHFYVLPDGMRNSDVLRFYNRAKDDHLYPASETHNGNSVSTYLLTNEREFFAVTASLYLWGNVDREPHNRERLKMLQPIYYAWLARQFGVQK
jgi:hypothetical protein